VGITVGIAGMLGSSAGAETGEPNFDKPMEKKQGTCTVKFHHK
jgi:hypothetical protein